MMELKVMKKKDLAHTWSVLVTEERNFTSNYDQNNQRKK